MEVDLERIERRLLLDLPYLRLVWRKGWGAKEPEDTTRLMLPVKVVLQTYTETPPCTNDFDCRKTVKELQKKHMEEGCTDIQWNFLVGGSGKVYEGRGWDVVAQKLPEFDAFDRKSLDIAYIGNSPEDVTKNMVVNRGLLIKLGLLEWFIESPYRIIEAKSEDIQNHIEEAVNMLKGPVESNEKRKKSKKKDYDDIINITEESTRMEIKPQGTEESMMFDVGAESDEVCDFEDENSNFKKEKKKRSKRLERIMMKAENKSKKNKSDQFGVEGNGSMDDKVQSDDEEALNVYDELLKRKKKSKKSKRIKGMQQSDDEFDLGRKKPKRKPKGTKTLKVKNEIELDEDIDFDEEDEVDGDPEELLEPKMSSNNEDVSEPEDDIDNSKKKRERSKIKKTLTKYSNLLDD